MAVLNNVEPVASPPADSPGSRFSWRFLCLLVLLYIPVQWVVGRHPGSTSIFSSDHWQLGRGFLDMDSALRWQLVSLCTQHGVHDIFFSAADVVSPYLVNQATPACTFHRETDVTPMAPAQKLSCSAVIVDENLPNAWNPVHRWETLGPIEQNLVALSTWESEGKQFGFRILQARSCRHAGETAEER
jgi:hypothetical protein